MNRGRCSGAASTAGSLLRDCDPDHDLAPSDPDPALQIQLDLSHVNYLATANSLDLLPAPLRDRFRIVTFPKPAIDDLNALLPALHQTIAPESGLDARWIAPLDTIERAAIAKAWPGGSIRRLQRILGAILLARDHAASRH